MPRLEFPDGWEHRIHDGKEVCLKYNHLVKVACECPRAHVCTRCGARQNTRRIIHRDDSIFAMCPLLPHLNSLFSFDWLEVVINSSNLRKLSRSVMIS